MNTEILNLKERIELAREVGEGHFTEFKSIFEGKPGEKKERDFRSVCQDVGTTLVAFANADGGELLIGVEDNGDITGVTYNENTINAILKAPKTYVHEDTPLPSYRATVVDINGVKVVYFTVPKGTEYLYITSDGKCMQRKDLQSVPISPEEIRFERQEIKSREYDRLFVDKATISDLDFDLVNAAAKEFSKTISGEKYLQHLDLAEWDGIRLRLRMASLLLFSKNAHKWHPRLQVRILKVSGNEIKTGVDFNILKDEEINDNILRTIERSWEMLRPYLTETKFLQGALFKSQIIYPELACREALINAIAHRDYSLEGQGIEVYIFDNRLEIKSPGELLSSIKVDDIRDRKGVHQSRNSNVAKVLREIGYMRELGEGFRRIFQLMESSDLIPPDINSSHGSFTVKMYQKFIFTEEENVWLENFKGLTLTREQKTVIRLGAKGVLISPQMIWDAVGIIDTEDYRKLVASLQNLGILISNISSHDMRTKKYKDRKSVARFSIVIPAPKIAVKPSNKKTSELIKPQPQTNTKEKPKDTAVLDDSEYAKIFIQNVYTTRKKERELKDMLYDEFSKFGEISSINLPINPSTGMLRGFGYIEFKEASSVIKALNSTLPITVNSKVVSIRPYKPVVKDLGGKS